MEESGGSEVETDVASEPPEDTVYKLGKSKFYQSKERGLDGTSELSSVEIPETDEQVNDGSGSTTPTTVSPGEEEPQPKD